MSSSSKIPDFDFLVKGDGKIYFYVAIDIAPFFTYKLEKRFFYGRCSEKFTNLIDNTILEKVRKKEDGYAEYDSDMRAMEKKGYDLQVFRGIIFNDFFTPTYSINAEKLKALLIETKDHIDPKTIIHVGKVGIPLEIVIKKSHASIIKKIIKIIDGCESIHIKFSYGGIAYMFMEKNIKEKQGGTPIDTFNAESKKILESPYNENVLDEEIEDQTNDLIKDIKAKESKIGGELGGLINDVLKGGEKTKFIKYILKRVKTQKSEQVFNSYLWALSIYSIHFFLKEYGIGREVAKILAIYPQNTLTPVSPNATIIDYLKSPVEVKYGKKSFTKNSPPSRNYFLAYHFPNNIVVKEKSGEDPASKVSSGKVTDLYVSEHFDCAFEPEKCPIKHNNLIINENKEIRMDNIDTIMVNEKIIKRKGKCLLDEFGPKLISLLEGSLIIKEEEEEEQVKEKKEEEPLPPPILKRKALEIPKLDLSTWKGEFCLVESEVIVICNPKHKINLRGEPIDYDDYWKCIIHGLGFITGGKTFAQIIHRLIIEWTSQYRENVIEQKKDKAMKIENKITILSTLLSRARIALSSSMISRAPYARRKFQRFLDVTGIEILMNTIEYSFNELNSSVTHNADVQRQARLSTIQTILGILGLILTILSAKWLWDFLKSLGI